MSRIVTSIFSGFIALLLSVSPAVSADIALVLGNRSYQNLPPMSRNVDLARTTAKLRDIGYIVMSGRNVSAGQTSQILEEFIAGLGSAEHAVILLNGRFAHTATDTWFLPVDATAASLSSVTRTGVSLNLLLDLVAGKQGRAAVFLGETNTLFPTGRGLKPGIGAPNIPQGVFLATGTPADIALTLRRDFLASGQGFADALAVAPNSVSGFGFVANIGTLTTSNQPAVSNHDMLDEGYWQAVRDLGGAKAMNAYLRAFPDGAHRDEALSWLQAQTVPRVIVQQPKDIENALGLGRTQRRNIQRNLTRLGYDTRGIDGYFGRGSRAAIANWQADQNQRVTGYLTRQDILRIARQADRRAKDLAAQKRQQQAAREQADQAYWASSGAQTGTEKGLRRYLGRYPNGLYSGEASGQLNAIITARKNAKAAQERNAWGTAALLNSVFSYETFLARFPNGYYSAIAIQRLNGLRRANNNKIARKNERDFWASSGAQAGKERGLRDYLNRYPNGIYASAAHNKLNDIKDARIKAARKKERTAWGIALLANSVAGYNAFLFAFPNGDYANLAAQRLGQLQNAKAPANPGPSVKQAEAKVMADATLIEQMLKMLGYDPGNVDGTFDKNTRRAIRKYQKATGMPVTGYADAALVLALKVQTGNR